MSLRAPGGPGREAGSPELHDEADRTGPRSLPGPEGYCSTQLIPYLGNKRALLPRYRAVFERLTEGMDSPRFLDAFSGSGAVGRLARALGMRVAANDWEPYSEALNRVWLGLRPSDALEAFGGRRGLVAALNEWNGLWEEPARADERPYMARWYAPSRTDAPLIGQERLFYTAENARFLDRARHRLERDYPESEPGSPGETRRRLLLGALLLEAATHANTSGVFKAYHRGFGGHGGDALGRILARMELEAPVLCEREPAEIERSDVLAFVSGRSAELAYFDPPYNQHQYGSNYHILNTLVRWDGRPAPMKGAEAAGVSSVAGIPELWKTTRSRFCVRKDAPGAIAELRDAADAALLLFSWNADAHLSGEELLDLLAPRGELEVVALDHVSYRGGRQSASRVSGSTEYIYIVDTRRRSRDHASAASRLRERARRDEALSARYDPSAVAMAFSDGRWLGFFDEGGMRPAKDADRFLDSLGTEDREACYARLKSCACDGVASELDAVIRAARGALAVGRRVEASRLAREGPRLLRKLAHGKYEALFRPRAIELARLADDLGYEWLARRTSEIARLLAERTES